MVKKSNNKPEEHPGDGLQVWKVVGIFALVFTAVQLAIAAIGVGGKFLSDTISAGANLHIFLFSTITRAAMVAAILLITMPVIRSVYRRRGLEGLYPIRRKEWKDVLSGMAIAAGAMVIVFILTYALGFITITGFALSGQTFDAWLRAIWLALLVNAVAAIGEEVLYRGLLLQGIEIAWDQWGALFISSIIFGGSHILVAGANESNWLQFIPLLALPGIMLGWAYLQTGNLWLATGIHFSWNLFQDDILNLTGTYRGDTLFGLETTVSGPKWFVGTAYGIEVGVAGILCLLLVSVGIWWWTRRAQQKTKV